MTKQELAKVNELAVPDFIKPTGAEGTEHITQEDIIMPRLAIAQAMSPQLKDSNPLYIEDLRVGDLFNTLTSAVYGKGPLNFHIVRAFPPRWMEFIPREQGGGIRDRDVPHNDPRTMFGPNGEPPIATKFYDYIIALVPLSAINVIALSMKSTQIKVARRLNGLIKSRVGYPLYAGMYSVKTVDDKNALGEFKNYHVANVGWAKSSEDLVTLSKLFEELKDRPVAIHIDAEQEDYPEDVKEPIPETDIPF
jgi:hypothetical protein